MTQYCRYCAHCVTGNGIFCTERAKEMTERKAKRTNHCPYFAFVKIDAFDYSKEYRPRQKAIETLSNISIDEILKGGEHVTTN